MLETPLEGVFLLRKVCGFFYHADNHKDYYFPELSACYLYNGKQDVQENIWMRSVHLIFQLHEKSLSDII